MKDSTTITDTVLEQLFVIPTINTGKIEGQTSSQIIEGSPLTDENHHLYEHLQ
ncbi:hypothetical protein Q4Q39_14840 [Flavivirga amylovorans]|uniref:Uncharacterized protein n=1 Tax=Flavivirga amylovorans TaxID=870486 RepID=A0ABT8X4T3_9FLAO|nr:hypothetical protein [Flavivirga amylovorans]MDO5988687.1 hypothetical protein [Flavivirga amylovorans]